MLQQERTIIEIGEPNVDILPTETADYFYTTILNRITTLIGQNSDGTAEPSKKSEFEENDV